MSLVSDTVLEEWTVLSNEAVVSRVLDGQVALFEILMYRCCNRPELLLLTAAL